MTIIIVTVLHLFFYDKRIFYAVAIILVLLCKQPYKLAEEQKKYKLTPDIFIYQN